MKINPDDFKVHKFYPYYGANHYLDRKALVFNIFLEPKGPEIDFYKQQVYEVFPKIKEKKPSTVINLFAEVILQMLKMDINLYINNYEISQDEGDYVIAVEFLDRYVAEDVVHVASDWFKAMNNKAPYDIQKAFEKLQADFDKTLYGGPTLYSLVEAGLKRNIPVFFLTVENQFQWGYGRKQLRGRSTTFHTDSIKDTEFTMYKDMVGDFLIDCGFPTPIGEVVFDENEAVAVAEELKYPVVVKPVAGHKGQGVTTEIESAEEVKKAFNNILIYAEKEEISFDGALVQQQIYGTDHRLLTVGGKFAAALQRVPAYVEGNGQNTIKELIEKENNKTIRLDNARSPLCKIQIDKDLTDYLKLQDLELGSVPQEDEKIYLRRVANISAGGVSMNVSEKMHPDNIKMVESIAKFFQVKCLGIDVLAKDIAESWKDGNFGIIEINAGPGVFMHLAPAIGDSIDVPGLILGSHFPTPQNSLIPIIAGNNINTTLAKKLSQLAKNVDNNRNTALLTEEGIFFDNEFFHKNKSHEKNIEIILRNPGIDFAIINHQRFDMYDYGFYHESADIVILENADPDEQMLQNLLVEDGILININENKIFVKGKEKQPSTHDFSTEEEKNEIIISIVQPIIGQIVTKYD